MVEPPIGVEPSSPSTPAKAEFDEFVRTERAKLVEFLRRRIASREDAEDIAQESFARMIRYRDFAVSTWPPLLYRIAVNIMNDRGRHAKSHDVPRHVSLEIYPQEFASLDAAHEQRIDSQQQLEKVQHAIGRMSERCRDIYLLNRIEGMSYKQIAVHCGISVKAVEKQISKALGILRKELERYGAYG